MGKTRFPRIVAAQRLQTWLLIAALLSVFLIGFLVVDLARNLRTVVISETNKTLANATNELAQSGQAWLSTHKETKPDGETADQDLRRVSYEVLRSYPDVEGGYVYREQVVGHTFPTYTEPGSRLRQPAIEHQEVIAALIESRQTGTVSHRVLHDGKDVVIVSALAGANGDVSAWCLRRIFNFSDTSEINKRMLLVAFMIVALVSIGIVLRLSFSMQRGFAVIQTGLERLRTDASYRLPDQNHELSTIVKAVNTMAAGRQVLEADLRREDRLRVMGRVVAGIAHEIRNPLNSIRLTIRVLARRLQDGPAAKEPITLITSEIDRLDTLLKSLLVFRSDSIEKIRQQPLRPILDRTLALVRPHAEERGVAVQISSPEECTARVDGDYLQQALMNLLLNAIDASGKRGNVDVSVHRNNGQVEMDIEDSGPGLSAEQQERIFEAFYTTKAGGTGLGLAVTKTLLEKMGATIESAKGTRGARFHIVLPAGPAV